uniref:Uncharacterized protein n=1 Tax=Anopheles epiroticus TaxID=199890 RepID=A0A182P0G6_9DIPT
MKAVYVVALCVCLAVATQAAPQFGGIANLLNNVGQIITGLVSQLTTLVNNVIAAGGAATQTIVANVLSLVFALGNTVFTLIAVPSSALQVASGLLNNALAQISSIVAGAGTTLTTLVPALGNVQTVLLTLANNLAALNQTGLTTLQTTLVQLANTLGTVAGQISG